MRSLVDSVVQHYVPLTVAILSVITCFSLLPLAQLPEAPGSDKLHHSVAYALLMLPTALRKPKYWVYAGLGFVVWSGLIELIQPMVNRYGEWLDLVANTGGVVIGAVLGLLLAHLLGIKPAASH